MFLLETVLSLWTGLPYDMTVWFQTGSWMDQGINIYQPANHLGYPPLWSLWCFFSYRAYLMLNSSIEAWRLVVKLPMIISHLALAVVIGAFAAKEFSHRVAPKIFFVILTWSFFIYIGAMWGQINIISVLLTFLAFWAITKNRTTTGGLSLGAAVALKIYPLVTFPVFLLYLVKQKKGKQAARFSLYVFAVPILLVLFTFTVFQWNILYFLKTLFYWTPVFESAQPQIQGGCMNFWSYVSLLGFDVSNIWVFRLLWVPVLAGGVLFWYRRPMSERKDLNLALITMYLLFLISYGFATEQSFLDPLPFIFLEILAYHPRRLNMYIPCGIQGLVYAFSATNYGEFIFQPLLEMVNPSMITSFNSLFANQEPMIWQMRGVLGLIISVSIGVFLLLLLNSSGLRSSVKDHSHEFARTEPSQVK